MDKLNILLRVDKTALKEERTKLSIKIERLREEYKKDMTQIQEKEQVRRAFVVFRSFEG